MDISDLLSNQNLAGFIITLAGQSILISMIGTVLIKSLSARPAPVRSLVCGGTIAAMGFLLLISAGFYRSDISWCRTGLFTVFEKCTTHTPAPALMSLPFSEGEELSQEQITAITVPRSATSDSGKIPYLIASSDSHSKSPSLSVSACINIAGLIWFAGTLFCLFKLTGGIITVIKFRNSLQHVQHGFYNKMLKNVARRFWKNRVPKLYTSSEIESPVTIGLINPIVIIPEKLLLSLDENEIKSIFLHELAHIFHGDHAAGLFKRIVLALHWWNPFLYLINIKHEQAREDISDNYVLSEMHPRIYTRCLVDLAEKVCLISNLPTAVSMSGKNLNLRTRVDNILSKKRSITMGTKIHFKALMSGLFILVLFGIAGLQGKVQATANDTYNAGNNESISVNEQTGNIIQEKTIIPDQDIIYADLRKENEPHDLTADLKKSEIKISTASMPHAESPAENKQKIKTAPEPIRDINTSEETVIVEKKNNSAQETFAGKPSSGGPVISESGTVKYDQENASTFIESGKNEYKKNHFFDAVTAFNKAIALDPDNAVTFYLRGNTYFKTGEIDQAISDYTRAIEIDPEYVYAYAQRAYIYGNKKGDYLSAINDLNKAIELNPQFFSAYYGRAEFNKAEILRTPPINTENHILASRLIVSDYKKALELNPQATFIKKKIDEFNRIYKRVRFHDIDFKMGLLDDDTSVRDKEIVDSMADALRTENSKGFINHRQLESIVKNGRR